jgi:uncharacterized protein (TIGR03437 family)
MWQNWSTLAVGETSANRVQRVSSSCAVDDISNGTPGGVAYDAKGNLYVAEGGIWELPAGAVPPAPGFVGLSQINVIVPQDAAPSQTAPVNLVVGGSASAQMVTIVIK